MPAADSILVIRGGALGDFVLTLPVLSALRETFPRATISVLGYPHIAKLALLGKLVDEVHPLETPGLARFFVESADLPEQWEAFFHRFTLIISYLYDPDRIFEENVRRVSRALYLRGPHRPDERLGVHAVECFMQPLRHLGIKPSLPYPLLRPLGHALPPAPPAGTMVLAVHPGSGSRKKNWPVSCWKELLVQLQAHYGDLHFCLIGGEADQDEVTAVLPFLDPSRTTLCLCRPLDEVISRLLRCNAYIGHDSGISHLAAALERRSLLLWGPSNEVIWRPPQPWVEIVKHPSGLAALPVAAVLKRLRGILDAGRTA